MEVCDEAWVSELHTVSFDWFLSGLGWIINLEFCYYNFWNLIRNYYGISDLGLTLPHYEFWRLYLDMFDQIEAFITKNEDFDQIYLNTGSKTQNGKSWAKIWYSIIISD